MQSSFIFVIIHFLSNSIFFLCVEISYNLLKMFDINMRMDLLLGFVT